VEASTNSKENLQLQLGDQVSIYSEKAYRKNKGLSFEAVGNVVIIAGKDTLYGERASFNVQTGDVKIEGNVRYISQGLTLYGTEIAFNSQSGQLAMINARIITSDFSIVASELKKIGDDLYYAKEAEFTTCKDCVESWTIYGNEIYLELNQYVRIHHALTRIKGVSVLYFPYIALPIKNKRESGLLFPMLSSRLNEGMIYQQPIFWAIDDSKDLTLSPSFFGRRGLGMDAEYRQVFGENQWMNINTRLVNDAIYEPGKLSNSNSDNRYFRSFYDLEARYQVGQNSNTHIHVQGMKDLDMLGGEFNNYIDPYMQSSDVGLSFFTEKKTQRLQIGLETQFKRNLLVDDAESFDPHYVQVLPSVYFSIAPTSLLQSDKFFLQHISVGLDSDFTVFRQMQENENLGLRNTHRFNLKPYLDWHLFSVGPIKAKTHYSLEFQHYDFIQDDERNFNKYAGLLTTEFSFSMDKIFGLSYEESIPVAQIRSDYLDKLGKENEEMRAESSLAGHDLIGQIPRFESTLTQDNIKLVKHSYRHSQEFKFLHHYIAHSKEEGNATFRNQIDRNTGWFDYDDGIRKNIFSIGSFQTRTQLPLTNTIEFQWNNTLIRKSPRLFNLFQDERYLRDNFSYNKIGYFNLSQGVDLSNENAKGLEDSLTRLFVSTGYSTTKWNLDVSQYYFHQTSDQIFNLGFQRRYEIFSLLAAYHNNTLAGADLHTLRSGFQIRPMDILGFSMVKEMDLDAGENIRSIYQVDYMPNNNCWIFNLNYRETVNDTRYAFNMVFNFGNDEFKDYRTNFFRFDRLNL
jgi:LPS-assembly protein